MEETRDDPRRQRCPDREEREAVREMPMPAERDQRVVRLADEDVEVGRLRGEQAGDRGGRERAPLAADDDTGGDAERGVRHVVHEPTIGVPPTGRKRLVRVAHFAAGAGRGVVAKACRRASSAAVRARSKTATPPIQPVKPTPRELWMTRPMVNGPPVPSAFGV